MAAARRAGPAAALFAPGFRIVGGPRVVSHGGGARSAGHVATCERFGGGASLPVENWMTGGAGELLGRCFEEAGGAAPAVEQSWRTSRAGCSGSVRLEDRRRASLGRSCARVRSFEEQPRPYGREPRAAILSLLCGDARCLLTEPMRSVAWTITRDALWGARGVVERPQGPDRALSGDAEARRRRPARERAHGLVEGTRDDASSTTSGSSFFPRFTAPRNCSASAFFRARSSVASARDRVTALACARGPRRA